MGTAIGIFIAFGMLFGAYQIPQVREQAKPYVDRAVEVLSHVKTQPTGTVIDRPEFQPKD